MSRKYRGKACRYCKKQLTRNDHTTDHYRPIWRGGTDAAENRVPCCTRCNIMKGPIDGDVFMLVRNDPVALKREHFLAQRKSLEVLRCARLR